MAEVDKAAPEVKAPEQEPQDGVEKKDAPAPRQYSQEDLDRITAKVRRNAARDAELKFRREHQAAPPPPKDETPPPPKEDVEPKRDDFETHEEWQAAQTKFVARQAVREEREKVETEAKQRTATEQQEQAKKTWHGKIEKAMSKLPDFEDVLEENDSTMNVVYGAEGMRTAITESDIGPEIVYHLCKHPEEAKRIAALPRYKQAAAIAKIEDDIAAAAKPKDEPKDEDEPDDENEVKETPDRGDDGKFKSKETPKDKDLDEPIEPVGGRGSGANSSLPSDKDDPETWRRKEYARIRKLQGK